MAEHPAELTGYPDGDAADWKRRYRPWIAEVLEHRKVEKPSISVVVVAWKTPHLVISCLDHIRSQDGYSRGDIELVLVDNGGLEPARSAFPSRVDLEIRMKENVGLCPARNAGVAWAKAPLIGFIDDDGLIRPDYYQRAVAYFDDPDVVAIRSRIVAKWHRYFTTLANHYDRGMRPVEDCLVTEGSAMVRRGDYIAVGGFAESLSGHEGIDLTYRFKQENPDAKVLYAPDVVMAHDYIDSWSKFYKKNFRYAGVDDRVADRDEGLARFMKQYFARSFPAPRLAGDERVAKELLKAARTLLRGGARAYELLQRR